MITLQGNGTSPSFFIYEILQFTKGSIVGTADGTCTGTSVGTTTLNCSGSITPTGSIELVITSIYANADLTGLGTADNSTPGFTMIPSSASGGSGGTYLMSYYIGNPPAGTVTPGYTNLSASDPLALWAGAFK